MADANGKAVSVTGTLPAGTLYIPLAQGMKHWIQALLGENPYIPYDYFYDVVTWSYPLQRGLAGSGFLTQQMSPGVQMTEIHGTSYGTVSGTTRRCTRSTPTRCKASASPSTCSTRA